VIDAAKKLPKRNFVVVGEGRLEKEIVGIPNVRFFRRLAGDDKRAAFCDASMLLMPSVIETEGIVAQEAMLCKTPVLISGNPVLREVVGKGGISCGSMDGFTENAEMLFTNPAIREEMGERGLEEVKKRDIRASVDALVKLYESM
jgi:glycosyltransferase involved in cell wall biosynthesis